MPSAPITGSASAHLNLSASATARVIANFAWQHMKAAITFRDQTLSLETEHATSGFGPHFEDNGECAMTHYTGQIVTALLGSLALVSCGGGGGDIQQEVQITEVPPALRSALSGDWPLQATTSAFIVHDEQSWKRMWDARKAALNCSLPDALDYNVAACNSVAPPAIDFANYTLVGVLLQPFYYFVLPSPTSVHLESSSTILVVSYQYHVLSKVSYYVTGTRFFLVPKTNATLDARASEA